MATLAELLVRIGADATSFERDMGKVENKIKRLGGQFEDVGKRLTTGLTLPLAGLVGLAFKSAIEFESAFAGVRKTVDATDAQLAQLEKGIRELAKQMPASATEIAAVAEAAGQLGIKTENILKFSKVMVDLGVATDLTADQAATAIGQFVNITQLSQGEVDRLASTLVALGNAGASTESQIMEMALRIAGAGKQVGMAEHQILAFASALASVGINAEAGGSAISRAMIAIENAVASGGEKLRLFAQVSGMSVSEFKRAWEQDAGAAMVAFIDGLGRLSRSGENVFQVLDKLGLSEITVRDALLRATTAGDLFRQTLEIGNKAWQENTALTKEAEQRYATTASKLQVLLNHLKDVAITLGESLAPSLHAALTAAQPLIDAVQRMAEWFANLSPETQKVLVTIGGIVALLGPLLVGFGLMVKTVSGLAGVVRLVVGAQGLGGLLTIGGKLAEGFALWTAGAGTFMETLSLVVGPAGIWIAAIAAIIAIGVLLWTHWDEIKAFLIATWDAISAKATAVWGALTTWLSSTWESIRTTASNVWQAIKDFFAKWWDELLIIFGGPIGILIAMIIKNWDLIASTTAKVWGAISAKTTEIWNAITGFLSGIWDSIRSTAAAAWEAIYNTVSGPVNRVKDAITGALTAALDWLKGQASQWLQAGKDLFKSLVKGIASVKIPLPTVEIKWVTGPMGIQYPKFDLGVNWRTLGDLIPFLAEGGRILREGLAVVGERGPEVVSLPRGAEVAPLPAMAGVGAGGRIVVNVTGNTFLSDYDMDRFVNQKLAPALDRIFRLRSGYRG